MLSWHFLLLFIGYCFPTCSIFTYVQQGQTIDDIPTAVLEDAAQLVKANSIQGCKMNDVDVVYTMWTNLKKTDGMEVGQVGIQKEKEASFRLSMEVRVR
jgi:hypothetical protein